MQSYMQAISLLPPDLTAILSKVDDSVKSRCMEICFRVGQPIVLNLIGECRFVSGMEQSAQRVMQSEYHKTPSLRISAAQLADMLKRLLGYSIHTHAAELHEGYITLKGGHRAGFCGSYTVAADGSYPYRIGKIQSLHLRIAREQKHSADALVKVCNKEKRLCSFLIVGIPGSGKTTLLRDFARAVSGGECCGQYFKVSVLDERGELCAVSEGMPQFSLGVQTDCFTGYPKTLAASMAVRTMSPQLLVLDELTGQSQLEAVKDSFYCGVRTAASIHASSIEELQQSKLGSSLLMSECFDYLVLLDGVYPGSIRQIVRLQEQLC